MILRRVVASALVVLWLVGCRAALPPDGLVRRVIDGDTMQLSDGQLVRYLGINAPEVRRRVAGRWIFEPEPFGLEATAANRQLVEHQRVRLEYDARTRDRFGRLLAYVYVGRMMVNAELLRRGFARLLIIPPNGRYAEQFRALHEEAVLARRGMFAQREDRSR